MHVMLGSSTGKKIHLHCRRPQFNSWIRKIPWRRDRLPTPVFLGFPGGPDGKESACNIGDLGLIPALNSWVGKIPWRRAWQPPPVFLPGESPWTEEPGGLQSMRLDMTEQLITHSTYNVNLPSFWFTQPSSSSPF